MSERTYIALFITTSLGLLVIGIQQASWWPLAGGVMSAVAAAWIATEDA